MSKFGLYYSGDPYGNRTHVNGVRGRCLNRLTNGPQKREAGIYLFSQAVSSQLSSAQVSLTSVFGMGTGGTSPSLTPATQMTLSLASLLEGMYPQTEYRTAWQTEYQFFKMGSSPRPISTSLLNASRRLHMMPINLVVFKGSYLINSVGYLILRSASRLDAFSVYPIRT